MTDDRNASSGPSTAGKQSTPVPPDGTPSLTEGYLTARETAERMGLPVEAVRAQCNDGVLSGAVRKQGRWYVPLNTVEAKNGERPQEPSSPKGGRIPTTKVVSVAPVKEPGPPAWWQRFRYNPWIFYPVTVISVLIVLAGVLFGLIQAGADFGGFSKQVKEWGLVREFAAERKGETLIVIARFYHSEGVTDIEAHNEIRDAIRAAAQELGESSLRVTVSSVPIAADDQERARRLGEKYNASSVIWGADTGVRVTVNFLNLRNPDFGAAVARIDETRRTQLSDPSAYASFVTRDLPGRLAFLSLFAVGQSYHTRGQNADAIVALQMALASLSQEDTHITDVAQAHFYLGYLLQIAGRNELAEDSYNKVITLQPANALAYSNRGVTHSAQGSFREAFADYDMAIALQPDFAEAYNNRGSDRYERGDFSEAMADFDRAIALRPTMAEAYHNRGNVRLKQGDLAGAIADFDRAIALRSNYVNAYHSRALARFAQGDLDGALSDINKALALDPNDAETYLDRGNIRSKQGDAVGAIVDYGQAIALKPDYAEGYNNRGTVYDARDDFENAIADYGMAIELRPDYADAYGNRGVSRLKQGDKMGAIADFDRAIALDANYAAAYYNRGILRAANGDRTGAVADYRIYLQLLPNSPKREQVGKWIAELEQQVSKP